MARPTRCSAGPTPPQPKANTAHPMITLRPGSMEIAAVAGAGAAGVGRGAGGRPGAAPSWSAGSRSSVATGRSSPRPASWCPAVAASARPTTSTSSRNWPTRWARRWARPGRRWTPGYYPPQFQVGQTGKTVSPQLYIALGHLRRDPAPGRHADLEDDHRGEQGRRRADLRDRRLRRGGRPVHGGPAAAGGGRQARSPDRTIGSGAVVTTGRSPGLVDKVVAGRRGRRGWSVDGSAGAGLRSPRCRARRRRIARRRRRSGCDSRGRSRADRPGSRHGGRTCRKRFVGADVKLRDNGSRSATPGSVGCGSRRDPGYFVAARGAYCCHVPRQCVAPDGARRPEQRSQGCPVVDSETSSIASPRSGSVWNRAPRKRRRGAPPVRCGAPRVRAHGGRRAPRPPGRAAAPLRRELAESERRRALAEQHATATESEIRNLRSESSTSERTPPEESFGYRAEKLLRLAEQEAAEARAAAGREAAAVVEQARADAEQHRHEVEQSLIARSSLLDQQAAQRTVELQEREQQIAAQMTTARSEIEAHARGRAAGRRAAPPAGRGRRGGGAGPGRARRATDAGPGRAGGRPAGRAARRRPRRDHPAGRAAGQRAEQRCPRRRSSAADAAAAGRASSRPGSGADPRPGNAGDRPSRRPTSPARTRRTPVGAPRTAGRPSGRRRLEAQATEQPTRSSPAGPLG